MEWSIKKLELKEIRRFLILIGILSGLFTLCLLGYLFSPYLKGTFEPTFIIEEERCWNEIKYKELCWDTKASMMAVLLRTAIYYRTLIDECKANDCSSLKEFQDKQTEAYEEFDRVSNQPNPCMIEEETCKRVPVNEINKFEFCSKEGRDLEEFDECFISDFNLDLIEKNCDCSVYWELENGLLWRLRQAIPFMCVGEECERKHYKACQEYKCGDDIFVYKK